MTENNYSTAVKRDPDPLVLACVLFILLGLAFI